MGGKMSREMAEKVPRSTAEQGPGLPGSTQVFHMGFRMSHHVSRSYVGKGTWNPKEGCVLERSPWMVQGPQVRVQVRCRDTGDSMDWPRNEQRYSQSSQRLPRSSQWPLARPLAIIPVPSGAWSSQRLSTGLKSWSSKGRCGPASAGPGLLVLLASASSPARSWWVRPRACGWNSQGHHFPVR